MKKMFHEGRLPNRSFKIKIPVSKDKPDALLQEMEQRYEGMNQALGNPFVAQIVQQH